MAIESVCDCEAVGFSCHVPSGISTSPAVAAPSRRAFLSGLAGVALAFAVVPDPVLAAVGGTRRLRLHNLNTGDKFDGAYWRDGHYVVDALHRINVVLRDHRANQVHRIDIALFDLLASLGQRLEVGDAPFEVVSGYRAPRTNAVRRTQSRGVAKNSLHIQGMAIDVRVPGRDARGVYQTAVGMKRGGVGFYRKSGFVHVDTGPVRTWG